MKAGDVILSNTNYESTESKKASCSIGTVELLCNCGCKGATCNWGDYRTTLHGRELTVLREVVE